MEYLVFYGGRGYSFHHLCSCYWRADLQFVGKTKLVCYSP